MTRKNIFASVLAPRAVLENQPPPSPLTGSDPGVRLSPAVGKLAQALDNVVNRSVIDLDPKLIDPSPYPDRLPDDLSADFDAFRATIAAEGQKIPVQVRPHPSSPGRYQLAYGHRRWRAAAELGQPLKAIVTALSDAELAVTQGLENSARQDLTWIERALFAARMDAQKVKARDIYAALGVDDAQLTHMRAVTKVLPDDVVKMIGRAPKVGRRRWLELAEAFRQTDGAAAKLTAALSADRKEPGVAANKTLSADRAGSSPSDLRFQTALLALQAPAAVTRAKAASWKAADGKPFGTLKTGVDTIILTLDLKRQPDLAPRALELLAELRDELAKSLSPSNRKG